MAKKAAAAKPKASATAKLKTADKLEALFQAAAEVVDCVGNIQSGSYDDPRSQKIVIEELDHYTRALETAFNATGVHGPLQEANGNRTVTFAGMTRNSYAEIAWCLVRTPPMAVINNVDPLRFYVMDMEVMQGKVFAERLQAKVAAERWQAMLALPTIDSDALIAELTSEARRAIEAEVIEAYAARLKRAVVVDEVPEIQYSQTPARTKAKLSAPLNDLEAKIYRAMHDPLNKGVDKMAIARSITNETVTSCPRAKTATRGIRRKTKSAK